MGNIQIAITILCLIAIVLLIFFVFCHTVDVMTWITTWIWSNREEKVGLTRAKGLYNANGYLVHSDSDIHLDSTGSFKRFDSVDGDFKITLATTNLGCSNAGIVANGGSGGVGDAVSGITGTDTIPVTAPAEWNTTDEDDYIPPQPLRPAPVPISTSSNTLIYSPTTTAATTTTTTTTTETHFQLPKKQTSNEDYYPIERTSISPIPRPVSSVNVAVLASQSSFPVCLTPPPTPSTPHLSSSATTSPGGSIEVATSPPPTFSNRFTPVQQNVAFSSTSSAPGAGGMMAMEAAVERALGSGGGAPVPVSPPAAIATGATVAASAAAVGATNGSTVVIQQVQQDINSSSSSSVSLAAQCEDVEVISSAGVLKRAISCDSICSDNSIALGDLEEFNITGYLCIGLEYDSECCDLIVNVLEAKELIGTECGDEYLDTYVRVFLLPDKEATIQTRIYRSSSTPSYKERFLFTLNPREQSQRSLCFHVYATDMQSHTLIGEGEIRLADISLRQPVTTWVTLTDTGQRGTEFGEIMFSISYLPTAERLTVVVVKARNLKFQNESLGDSFVKVYLMQQSKKINKKKTSTKKSERSPIFNESMMFSVPAHTLPTIQLRLTVAEVPTVENTKAYPIGHVIVGSQASGRSLSHWNQMLTALRKPVAMWHPLRK